MDPEVRAERIPWAEWPSGTPCRVQHTVHQLRITPVGSVVVCGDRKPLFGEAPTPYKRIEQVLAELVDHRLATPVATSVPLTTDKTPDLGHGSRRHRRERGRQ